MKLSEKRVCVWGSLVVLVGLSGCAKTYNDFAAQFGGMPDAPIEPAEADGLSTDEPPPPSTDDERSSGEPALALALPNAAAPSRPGVSSKRRSVEVARHVGPADARPPKPRVVSSRPAAKPTGLAPERPSSGGARTGQSRDAARRQPGLADLRKGTQQRGVGGLRDHFERLLVLAGKKHGDAFDKQMKLMQAGRADLEYLFGLAASDRLYLPYLFRQRRMREGGMKALWRRAAVGHTRFHVVAVARAGDDNSRAAQYRRVYALARPETTLYRVYFQTGRTLTEDGPFAFLNGRWLYLMGLGSSVR